MKKYQQCLLRRATFETRGWVEQRAAIEGATVEILKPDHLAGDWTVVSVSDHVMNEDLLKDHQRLNRKSLPSIEAIA